jgi:S1-C subfamily serine protease
MQPSLTKLRPKMLVAALLITLFASAPAQAQTAREIARESFRSVVMIIAKQPNGKTVSLGTGFFVEPGVIATAYHVVKGASALFAKGVGERQLFQVRLVAVDAKTDLALLGRPSEPRIPPFSEFEATLALRGLPLGDSSAVEVGEEVYAVGNPEGLEGTFSQGIIDQTSISEVERHSDRRQDGHQICQPVQGSPARLDPDRIRTNINEIHPILHVQHFAGKRQLPFSKEKCLVRSQINSAVIR